MEIIKINKKIQLKDGSEVIEEYDFQDTINSYLAYLVKSGEMNENK